MGKNAEDQLRCSESGIETAPGLSDDSLSNHPRIVLLRQQVAAMPVDQGYRSRLFHSIDSYAAQIVSRPVYAPEEGWDDLEALQQVTLSDAVEQELQRLLQSPPIRPADVTYQGLPEENDHFIVMITKDKVMGRGEFLKAVESLDQPAQAPGLVVVHHAEYRVEHRVAAGTSFRTARRHAQQGIEKTHESSYATFARGGWSSKR